MKIAITGANGTVGRALTSQLDRGRFELTPLDLPDHDVSNLAALTQATQGHDGLVHMAWDVRTDNDSSGDIATVNTQMMINVYKAAVANGIGKVLMASSNHAHRHDMPDADGKIRASISPAIPDSPYGAHKLFGESLGHYYAQAHNLDVLCIRIGNVNPQDTPNSDTPPRWLSHNDLGRLVTAYLTAEPQPGKAEVMYGVSQQEVFDLSNSFGWEPEQHSRPL